MTPLALAGQFTHSTSLSPVQLDNVLRLALIGRVFSTLAQGLSKVSVALLVLRFSGPVVLWRRRFLIACIVSTILFTTLNVILIWIQCIPVWALWAKVPDAQCLPKGVQNHYAVFLGCKFSLQRLISQALNVSRLECFHGSFTCNHSSHHSVEP